MDISEKDNHRFVSLLAAIPFFPLDFSIIQCHYLMYPGYEYRITHFLTGHTVLPTLLEHSNLPFMLYEVVQSFFFLLRIVTFFIV